MSSPPGQLPAEDLLDRACSIDGFLDAFKDKEKAIVIYTQKDCPHCKVAIELLARVSQKTGVPLARIGLEDDQCNVLADKHEIKQTPTVLILVKGEVQDKLDFSTLTPEQSTALVLEKLGMIDLAKEVETRLDFLDIE